MNSRYILEHSDPDRQQHEPSNESGAPRMSGQFSELARGRTPQRNNIRDPDTRHVERITTSRLAEHPYLQHSYPLPKATVGTSRSEHERSRAPVTFNLEPSSRPPAQDHYPTFNGPDTDMKMSRGSHERSNRAQPANATMNMSRSEHVPSRPPDAFNNFVPASRPPQKNNRPVYPDDDDMKMSPSSYERSRARPEEAVQISRSEHVRSGARPDATMQMSRSTHVRKSGPDRVEPSSQPADITFYEQPTYTSPNSDRNGTRLHDSNHDRFHTDIHFSPPTRFSTGDDTSAQTSGEHPYEHRTYPRNRANVVNGTRFNNRSNHSASSGSIPMLRSDSYSGDENTDQATSQGSEHMYRRVTYPNEPMDIAMLNPPGRQRSSAPPVHFSPAKNFGQSEISSITFDDATGLTSELAPEYVRPPDTPDDRLNDSSLHCVPPDPWTFSPADPIAESEESSQVEETSSHATGRCPSLNLEWLLKLNDKRKGDAARVRGSLLPGNGGGPARRSIIEENEIVEGLMKQGFTGGLARTLIQNTDRFSVRIWVVNNSGSMNANDGHLVVQSAKPPYRFENESCTRWEEVQSCVIWHAELSGVLEAPMAVRFLHDPGVTVGPQQLGIAASAGRNIEEEMARLRRLFAESRPSGTTEMNVHLRDIVDSVVEMAPRLRQRGEVIALVIVTDTIPHDAEGQEGDYVNEEFKRILRMLQGLPVWIVIRLSTDEERVVNFYNDLDEHLAGVRVGNDVESGALATAGQSINIDVLDDFVSEAQEVHEHNPWLNYALPLHLCRESGVSFPAFDALDNRALLPSELADFVQLLFDRRCNFNPVMDYLNFRSEVEDMVVAERGLFNPIRKKFMPWIDMKELDKRYGSPSKAESSCNCTIQ